MKLSIKESAEKIFKVLFLSALLASLFSVNAQSINDDLVPKKKSNAKPASPRPKATRTIKPRTRPAPKKPRVRNTPPVVNASPAIETPVTNAQPEMTPETSAATTNVSAASVQNPTLVIERFMNFQQSASVTNGDWESVAAQTDGESINAQEKAQHFIAQGNLAFNLADYSRALIQFNAASLAMRDSSLPFYCIGKVYLTTKQPNQAENAFAKAIKLNKKFALAYQGLGDALTAQGKIKKAQEYYKEAARVNVSGNNSPESSSPNKAAITAGNSAAVDPAANTPESINALEIKTARALTARKKWQDSLDKLMPLAKINPSADAYIAIGDNYFGMEQWLSALEAYKEAAQLNTSSAPAFYKSGLVLFETNEYQSASEAFEKALILDQNGMSINRAAVRKMADKAGEKARDMKGKKKKFLGM